MRSRTCRPEYCRRRDARNDAGARLRRHAKAGVGGFTPAPSRRGRNFDYLSAAGGGRRRNAILRRTIAHAPRTPATAGSPPNITRRGYGPAFAAALEYDAPFDALFVAADDSASTVPTLQRLAGVYGTARRCAIRSVVRARPRVRRRSIASRAQLAPGVATEHRRGRRRAPHGRFPAERPRTDEARGCHSRDARHLAPPFGPRPAPFGRPGRCPALSDPGRREQSRAQRQQAARGARMSPIRQSPDQSAYTVSRCGLPPPLHGFLTIVGEHNTPSAVRGRARDVRNPTLKLSIGGAREHTHPSGESRVEKVNNSEGAAHRGLLTRRESSAADPSPLAPAERRTCTAERYRSTPPSRRRRQDTVGVERPRTRDSAGSERQYYSTPTSSWASRCTTVVNSRPDLKPVPWLAESLGRRGGRERRGSSSCARGVDGRRCAVHRR